MSANDIYIIREVRGPHGGSCFDVHHFDMDALLEGDKIGQVVARELGIVAAVKMAEEEPAEYNYRIEFVA